MLITSSRSSPFRQFDTKFPSFNIEMCKVYNVHFVCKLYGRKMLAALIIYMIFFPALAGSDSPRLLIISLINLLLQITFNKIRNLFIFI